MVAMNAPPYPASPASRATGDAAPWSGLSLRYHEYLLRLVQHVFAFSQRQADFRLVQLAILALNLIDFKGLSFVPVCGEFNANCDLHLATCREQDGTTQV